MQTRHIASIQMVSSDNVQHNIHQMQNWVAQAAAQGADWVVLPEYWAMMGQSDTDKVAIAEPFGDGRLQDIMRQTAQQHGIVLFGGTISLQSPEIGKVFNALLVYNRDGECISRYDKMHLFGFQTEREHYAESNTISAGNRVPQLNIDGWQIAQGICYDVRFPEFFRQQSPFDVLILPAAFTYTTGKAHWELLLKARAVENQCYVVASGQGGTHSNGRRTFGHSTIIDAWGDTLALHREHEGIAIASVRKEHLQQIRQRLPALQHRCL